MDNSYLKKASVDDVGRDVKQYGPILFMGTLSPDEVTNVASRTIEGLYEQKNELLMFLLDLKYDPRYASAKFSYEQCGDTDMAHIVRTTTFTQRTNQPLVVQGPIVSLRHAKALCDVLNQPGKNELS